MNKVSILLIDDHPIVVKGLQFFLDQDPGLRVVGVAPDGITGFKLLQQWHPEIIVMDLSMPKLDGLEAISLYRKTDPRLKIVVFTAHAEEKYVYQSLHAGAQGYVLKGSSPNELKQAIDFVRQGGCWVSPQFSQSIIQNYLNSKWSEDREIQAFDGLSDREEQVLRLMVAGKQTEEISEMLFISPNTVAKHRSSLMGKLGLKNIVELTKFAIRNGIIEAR